MLSVIFERDFQKISNIDSQQEKPVFSNSKNLVPTKHKKSPIRKNKLPQKFSATRYSDTKRHRRLFYYPIVTDCWPSSRSWIHSNL